MIHAGLTLLTVTLLVGCGGAPAGNPSIARGVAVGGGTCPDADPVRDGPLVDAIRRDDAGPVEARLASNPGDPRAQAALVLISGRGQADPDQAACFAPYLRNG